MTRFFIVLFCVIWLMEGCWSAAHAQQPNLSTRSQSNSTPSAEQAYLPDPARERIQENTLEKISPYSSKKSWSYDVCYYLFVMLACTGIIPVITFFIEYNLAGLHAFRNHYKKCKDYLPKVAVIIPAWNEGQVLEHTITYLLKTDYPRKFLKLYIIDDGSTDNTSEIAQRAQEKHPDNIVYLKKEEGGNGKAYAINYGLEAVLKESWAEAVLLIDADISFKKDALKRLTRHLADPEVGAVTSYIKVGNRKENYISQSVCYEYIMSQFIARRAQNVMGVVACLAGGAQLHTIENIKNLGCRINTSTLAEDTYTTFRTQKLGKKVIYEGNAVVYAQEPRTIIGLWKQRFRWARGNIQVTKAFKQVWFRHENSRLGTYFFGLIWFCVLLTPLFMITTALGLAGLFFLQKDFSSQAFFYLASVSLFVYLYSTLFALAVDQSAAARSWFQGIAYPGIVALLILLWSVNPTLFFNLLNKLLRITDKQLFEDVLLLFMQTWSGWCLLLSYLIVRLELAGVSTRITNFLIAIVGYGPLLCTINLAAYIAEFKKPSLKWDKTEKVSLIRKIYNHPEQTYSYNFEKELAKDIKREYWFFLGELISLWIVIGIFLLIK